MQGQLAKLSFFAITALALATVQPLWGQQPAGQVRKLTQPPSVRRYAMVSQPRYPITEK
jgi:hypothetical protein